MATLTDEQRTDLQADLGISGDESVFTNTELDRLYTRAASDYTATIVLALRQLLANASRLADYTAGQTSEKVSQIRDGLKDMLAYYESSVGMESKQVVVAGLRSTPPIYKELPYGEEHPDEKIRRHDNSLPQYRRRRRYGGW